MAGADPCGQASACASVANRILRSRTDADDTVRDAGPWLSRSNAGEIGNPGGWLTTVVAQMYRTVWAPALQSGRRLKMLRTAPVHFADRSCHIRRTSFVRVVADQVMRKGTGLRLETIGS
jgi:hypothetical protein